MPFGDRGMENASNQPRITRKHSGCKPCRRRGKKCDESKPRCRACARLSLECIYGIDYSFHNITPTKMQRQPTTLAEGSRSALLALSSAPSKAAVELRHLPRSCISHQLTQARIARSLDCGENLETCYLSHFQRHVRYLLPVSPLPSANATFHSPYLRAAALCISASNLSMLDAQVQSRILVGSHRQSSFSPLVNSLHHAKARDYHDRALQLCRKADMRELSDDAPAILTTQILLAYYHHASTNHQRFRSAVWDTVEFVSRNREHIMRSARGVEALQMWHRLCVSHRLSKPPSLLLDGEGRSSFGPNCFPDATDHLYLTAVLGMSRDDLIYDILIKTMEIRSRLVVFRCVAHHYQIPESSREVGSLAHSFLTEMLGRPFILEELSEARKGFVRGSHLLGLLQVQKERLAVWNSLQHTKQSPVGRYADSHRDNMPPREWDISTHRDTMNTLYQILCEMMFEEAHAVYASDDASEQHFAATVLPQLAQSFCHIVSTLDFAAAGTADVYTFSLAESLLQLVGLWQSDSLFHFILDVTWPNLEQKTRGFEHSHYPTHLVKRIISLVADYWSRGQSVTLVLPAVPEDIAKLTLLDINHPMDVVICGHDQDNIAWIDKIRLP
ncbi:transcriptional regulator family: Fungal Specific TF [Aspergillus niger]|nr:transcriptional regulator family: Fungal Specific TF [Aspergillus niger]